MATAFKFFDINQNGDISFNEFRLGCENLGIKFTSKELRQVFEYMDKQKEGQINYKKFCSMSEEKRRDIDPFEYKE